MTRQPRAGAPTEWWSPCTPPSRPCPPPARRSADVGHQFELPHEAVVEASPEEVWEAISTGPGIDSWFMGHTEVAGGVVRTAFGGHPMPDSVVTAAEPPRRLAHGSEKTD